MYENHGSRIETTVGSNERTVMLTDNRVIEIKNLNEEDIFKCVRVFFFLSQPT